MDNIKALLKNIDTNTIAVCKSIAIYGGIMILLFVGAKYVMEDHPAKATAYIPDERQKPAITRILQGVHSNGQKADYMGKEYPPIFYVTCMDNSACTGTWTEIFETSGWYYASWIKDGAINGDVLPIERHTPGIEIYTSKNSSAELIGTLNKAFSVVGLKPEIKADYIDSKIGKNHFMISMGPKE